MQNITQKYVLCRWYEVKAIFTIFVRKNITQIIHKN